MLLARVPGPQVYTDYIIIFPRVQFGNVQLKRYVTEMSKCAHCTPAPCAAQSGKESITPSMLVRYCIKETFNIRPMGSCLYMIHS